MSYKREVLKVFLGATVIFLGLTSLGPPQAQYTCANCENRAKTENSISEDYDELYLEEGQIITAIYVKAGQGCHEPDGTCYKIIGGGIGFNYVKIERVGDGPDCQGISHIEICYSEDSATDTPSPTDTSTPDPTSTFTPTPSETPEATYTPTPENTVTNTPTTTEDPPTTTPQPTYTPWPKHTPGNGRG